MKKIIKYQLTNGKIPFDEWFTKLDKSIKAKILVRLERVKNGDITTAYRFLQGYIERSNNDAGI